MWLYILDIGYWILIWKFKRHTVVHSEETISTFLGDMEMYHLICHQEGYCLPVEDRKTACNIFRAYLSYTELASSTSCSSLWPMTERNEGTWAWFFWSSMLSSDGQHSPESYLPGWPRLFLNLRYRLSILLLNWDILKNVNSQNYWIRYYGSE